MKLQRVSAPILGALVVLIASACSPGGDDRQGTDEQASAKIGDLTSTSETQPGASSLSEIGTVSFVEVKSTGIGPTPASAVDDALYSAVRQVNGASISGGTVQFASATSIRSTLGDVDIASTGFAQAIVSQSQGSITAFSLDAGSLKQLAGTDGQWQVSISAKIAKYLRPDASLRPALVVAEPRLGRIEVNAGSFSEELFSNTLKQITEDAITGTKRFAVVNRELTGEAVSELAIAQSSLSPIDQGARIGQLLSAEVVVIPTIQLAKYEKSVRELRTSDRELVSFNGALVIRFDVINATTGQTIFSQTYEQSPNPPKPTTLGANVNPQSELEALLAEVSSAFVADLNRRTFPVSVIAVDGDTVVLSQGGMSVREGLSYQAIRKGSKEFADPQTGQSLGRQEIEIGTVLIDRVDTNLAYGTLTMSASVDLADFKPGDIELRDVIQTARASMDNAKQAPSTATEVGGLTSQRFADENSTDEPIADEAPEEDPDW